MPFLSQKKCLVWFSLTQFIGPKQKDAQLFRLLWHMFIYSFVSTFTTIFRQWNVTVCRHYAGAYVPFITYTVHGHLAVYFPVVLSQCWQILHLLSPVPFRISVAYLVISAWHYAVNIMLSNNADCISKMWTHYFSLLISTACRPKCESTQIHVRQF